MIRVKAIEPLTNYQIKVSFTDGTSGVADLGNLVNETPFLRLQNQQVFAGAEVQHGAVEWPAGDVGIATEALYAMVHGLDVPTTLEQAQNNELKVSLRELRNLLGKTQTEVAKESGLTQGSVALFEGAPDHKLSALRRYLAALGCDLEIVAVAEGGRRFPLHGL